MPAFVRRWVRKNCKLAAASYNKPYFEQELLSKGFKRSSGFGARGSQNEFRKHLSPDYFMDVTLDDQYDPFVSLEKSTGFTVDEHEGDILGKIAEWEDRFKEWQKFDDAVAKLGFSCTGTGGGCTALFLTLDDGYYIIMTDDNFSEPEPFSPINFGLYTSDGEDVVGKVAWYAEALASVQKWIAGDRPSSAQPEKADDGECHCDMQHLLHKGHEEGCPLKKDLPMVGARSKTLWVRHNCKFKQNRPPQASPKP